MMVTEEQSLSSASSSIQDADWAEALTNLAQQQIMQSVDIAIQAQTNLARSPMLQLLV